MTSVPSLPILLGERVQRHLAYNLEGSLIHIARLQNVLLMAREPQGCWQAGSNHPSLSRTALHAVVTAPHMV